jgi:hypothetical protein
MYSVTQRDLNRRHDPLGEARQSQMEKQCTKCHTTKELREFCSDKRRKDGLRSACRDCLKSASQARYRANPGPWIEAAKRRYYADPEPHRERARARKKLITNAEKRRRRVAKGLPPYTEREKAGIRARQKRKARAAKLRTQYGITVAQYAEMVNKQQNRCAICRTPFNQAMKQLAPQIDHCHESGRVRGILCRACNTTLGRFKDDPMWLRAAIRHLGDSRNKQ